MAKILLVEDDKSLREIYGVRLLAEGYDIVSAGDGEEALAMAIKDRPDLIISDVMMPKISGFDMLDILRSTTETKGIKVIMMTALSSEDQRARGEALGADRYLVKSQVGIEDVVRTVHDVLGDSTIPATPARNPFETPVPAAAPGVARPAAPVVPPTRPVAEPLPAPTPPVPELVSTVPTPIIAPAPLEAPAPAPAPLPTQVAQPPVAVPAPTPVSFPQPISPSASPYTQAQPTLAERVIAPLEAPTQPVDMGDLINQELSGVNNPAAPLPPQPPVPPTPPAAF